MEKRELLFFCLSFPEMRRQNRQNLPGQQCRSTSSPVTLRLLLLRTHGERQDQWVACVLHDCPHRSSVFSLTPWVSSSPYSVNEAWWLPQYRGKERVIPIQTQRQENHFLNKWMTKQWTRIHKEVPWCYACYRKFPWMTNRFIYNLSSFTQINSYAAREEKNCPWRLLTVVLWSIIYTWKLEK